MRKLIPIVLAVVCVTGASAVPAWAEKVNISIGKDLPVGMKIFVTVGGDGGNCSGAATAEVGRGGTATVTLEIRCEPSGHPPTPGPNDKCRILARALDEAKDVQYKGQDRLTPTSVVGVFQSSFNMKVVVP